MEKKESYRTAARKVFRRQEPAKPTATLQDLKASNVAVFVKITKSGVFRGRTLHKV
jgi:hypothetical protein